MDKREQIQIIKMLALIEGLHDYTTQIDQTTLEKKFRDRIHLYSLDDTTPSTLFPYFQSTYLRCFNLESKHYTLLQAALTSALKTVQEEKTEDIVQSVLKLIQLLN